VRDVHDRVAGQHPAPLRRQRRQVLVEGRDEQLRILDARDDRLDSGLNRRYHDGDRAH